MLSSLSRYQGVVRAPMKGRAVHLRLMAGAALLWTVYGCDQGSDNRSSLSDMLTASQPASADGELRITREFKVSKADLTPEQRERAELLGEDCIMALRVHSALADEYYELRRKALARRIELEKQLPKGSMDTSITGTATGQACSPWSVTSRLGVTSTDSKLNRDQDSQSSGGTFTAGGGSAGSGAGGIQTTTPTESETDETSQTDTMLFTIGLDLTIPMGCLTTTTSVAADETHFMREALNGLYRQPIFCGMLKSCPLGLNPENLDNSPACGGSGSGMGFPGGGGSGGDGPGGGRRR